MKKLILLLLVLFSLGLTTASAQALYVASGLSISNTDNFKEGAYVSTELGIMLNNVSLAGVFGRNDLSFAEKESINNYWYEAKIAVYQPVGDVDIYGVMGIGTYVKNSDIFLEYGVGVSKTVNRYSFFIQTTSWDGVIYITPGVSFIL